MLAAGHQGASEKSAAASNQPARIDEKVPAIRHRQERHPTLFGHGSCDLTGYRRTMKGAQLD